MPFDKATIAALDGGAASAIGGTLATIGNAGLHAGAECYNGAGKLASATGNAVNYISGYTKTAIAAARPTNGFKGITTLPNSTFGGIACAVAAAGGMAAIGTAGLNAAGVEARKITAAAGGAFRNIAGGINAGNPGESGAGEGINNNYGINLPSKSTVIVVTAGATIAVAGATLLVPAVGFTVAGVKAGTLAATIHGAIGNVAAGCLFAKLQSAGVLGLAAATKIGIGVGGGVIGAYVKNKLTQSSDGH